MSLIGWLSFVSLGHFLICSVKGCTGQGVVFGLSKLNSVSNLFQTGPEPVSNRVGVHNHQHEIKLWFTGLFIVFSKLFMIGDNCQSLQVISQHQITLMLLSILLEFPKQSPSPKRKGVVQRCFLGLEFETYMYSYT